jgi:ribosomal protein S18 acetylase RimI-like enzyme
VEAELVGIVDFPPLRISLDALAVRPGTFYGLTRERRLVGAVEVEELGSVTRQIAALVVDPDCFRRGIGRRLIQFVLEDSPNRVLVSTSPSNTPALALYHSMGFRLIETHACSDGIDLCLLEWRASRTPAPEV